MVSSATFKKFLDATKYETRVLGRMERHILTRPKDESRRTDVFHPSQMSKDSWCYRATYFELLGNKPLDTKGRTSLSTQRVFDTGHATHAWYQDFYGEMGVLYGVWGCWHKDCKERQWGLPYPECSRGHGPLTRYKEVPLAIEDLKFGGHADGWLIGFGEPLLLEVKTVGEGTFRWEAPEMIYTDDGNVDWMDAWDKLTMPFTSHIMQAQIYLKLLEIIHERDPFPYAPPQEILFLYENKANQTQKEFVIRKDDWGIKQKFEAVYMILECIKNGTPPSCNVNSAEQCGACKGFTE
jgi:hypothetical protein